VKNKFLLIACGGTGGHLFPGIAVAEEWRARGGDVLLLISEKQIDSLASEGFSHLRFERLPAIAMPGLLSAKMPGFLVALLQGVLRCRGLLRSSKADAVLGMGGFTSTAPLAAGRMRGLPCFVHEANVIPGRANKLNARVAEAVLVGFDASEGRFGPGRNTLTVGTPLRPKVVEKPSREESLAYFGLDPERQTLMVMGGSQGARQINRLVAAGLAQFEEAGVQVLHLTGPLDYDEVAPDYEARPTAGKALAFCSEVQYVLAAADVAVCRAGASGMSELAFYEIPSVLIPYPFAADDHQTANALVFSEAGAAELWSQDDLDEESFVRRAIDLVRDAPRLEGMREQMGKLARPDAAKRVCDVIADSL